MAKEKQKAVMQHAKKELEIQKGAKMAGKAKMGDVKKKLK